MWKFLVTSLLHSVNILFYFLKSLLCIAKKNRVIEIRIFQTFFEVANLSIYLKRNTWVSLIPEAHWSYYILPVGYFKIIVMHTFIVATSSSKLAKRLPIHDLGPNPKGMYANEGTFLAEYLSPVERNHLSGMNFSASLYNSEWQLMRCRVVTSVCKRWKNYLIPHSVG